MYPGFSDTNNRPEMGGVVVASIYNKIGYSNKGKEYVGLSFSAYDGGNTTRILLGIAARRGNDV
jgi:hypothetical protein